MNVGKTVGMVFPPFQAAGTQLGAVYERRMMVEGLTYRERQRVMVQCLDYGEDMALGLLAVHQHNQNGKADVGRKNLGTTAPGREP